MRNRGQVVPSPGPEQDDAGSKGAPAPQYQAPLSGKGLVGISVAVGILFFAFGLACVVVSGQVVEIQQDYSDAALGQYHELELDVEREMKPPVYFYFQLDGFFQNHRRYMRSKSEGQLNGKELFFLGDKGLDKCAPRD